LWPHFLEGKYYLTWWHFCGEEDLNWVKKHTGTDKLNLKGQQNSGFLLSQDVPRSGYFMDLTCRLLDCTIWVI